MSIDRLTFDGLQLKYADHASWAVWGVLSPNDPFTAASDLNLPAVTPQLLQILRRDIVLLGLNPGNAHTAGTWEAFHGAGRSQMHRVAEALRGTRVWGAYMTDLFPRIIESDSAVVDELVKDPAVVRQNIEGFLQELADLGATAPVICCFGSRTADHARTFLTGSSRITERSYRVVKLDHYSGSNRKLNRAKQLGLSTEAYYRQLVHETLKKEKLL